VYVSFKLPLDKPDSARVIRLRGSRKDRKTGGLSQDFIQDFIRS